MWRRILTLIVKELWAVWRDPKTRAMLFIPPFLQMVVFSFAITLEVKNTDIGVLNRDAGVHSLELMQRLANAKDLVASVHVFTSEAEMAQAIASRHVIMAVRFPADFSRRIDGGQPAEMDVMLDGRRSNAAQILEGDVEAVVDQYRRELPAPPGGRGFDPEVVPRAFYNPNLEGSWSTVPYLLALLTMIIGLEVTGMSVAREREVGTFEQLLVSPARPFEIIVGKTVPGMILGIVEGSVIIAYAHWIFGIPINGSVGLLYLSMVVYLMAVIGIGLFISSLVSTQQQAMLGVFTFMAPAVTLSGFAAPIANMPDWLQPLTYADPIRYFLIVISDLYLKDSPASLVFAQVWPLAAIAVVMLAAASWLFRRRMG